VDDHERLRRPRERNVERAQAFDALRPLCRDRGRLDEDDTVELEALRGARCQRLERRHELVERRVGLGGQLGEELRGGDQCGASLAGRLSRRFANGRFDELAGRDAHESRRLVAVSIGDRRLDVRRDQRQ